MCTVGAVLILHQQCLERVAMAVETTCDQQCWVRLVQSAADELPQHVPLDLQSWTFAELASPRHIQLIIPGNLYNY